MSDSAPTRVLDWDIDNLPLDVFELARSGLEVEALTGSHFMVENGASGCASYPPDPVCSSLCGGCSGPPKPRYSA